VRNLIAKLALALCAVASASASFAEFPDKPIRVIVPFSPGGVDVIIRMIADDLGKRLGQPVIVENREGAGGNVGMQVAASAPADGYTLVMASTGNFTINQHVYRSFRVDPLKAFVPIMHVADIPGVLFSSTAIPGKDLASVAAYAKAHKGHVFYGSPGVATTPQLAMENLNRAMGLGLTHVPYKGSPAVLTGILAGDVQLGFGIPGTWMPYVEKGKLHVLAVSGDSRFPLLPQVPTFKELGLSHIGGETWWALAAPAGTPDAVLEKLNVGFRQALANTNVRKRLLDLGFVVIASTRAEMKQKLDREAVTWEKTLKDLAVPVLD
jgi:tripartite-type tricarboxylate transporter receptor subunit TctC